jgi:hypothetical protein
MFWQCSGFGAISTGGGGSSPEFSYFTFTSPSTVGTISGNNISVMVPTSANRANLVANFKTTSGSVRVGPTEQTVRLTANNFMTPVVYTLVGNGGKTRDYTVTVTPTNTDIFPPVISSITATPASTSTYPATVTVKIYFEETGSGYSSSIFDLCYNGRNIQLSSFSQTNMGAYVQGTVTIQNYHPSDTWRVCYVYISDAAGNTNSYNDYDFDTITNYVVGVDSMDSGVPVGGVVSVSGTTPDITPPVITSVTATPSSTNSYPTTVTIRAFYTETGSGYGSGSFSFCSPTRLSSGGTSGSVIFSSSVTNNGTYFQGTVTMQNYHEGGTWKVCSILISDLAGNINDYNVYHSVSTVNYVLSSTNADSGLAIGGPITLSGTTPDTTPPLVTSITATPASVSTYPATITLRAYYTETGSGFSQGSMFFCSPSRIANGTGGSSILASSATNAGAYMESTVTLQSYHEAGAWKVCSLSIKDAAGNWTSLTAYAPISTTYYVHSASSISTTPIGGSVVKH